MRETKYIVFSMQLTPPIFHELTDHENFQQVEFKFWLFFFFKSACLTIFSDIVFKYVGSF